MQSSLDTCEDDIEDEHEPAASEKFDTTQDGIMNSTRSFLIENEVFEWLLHRIRVCVRLTQGESLKQVSTRFFRGIRANFILGLAPTVRFNIKWDLISFLKANYSRTPDLASIIVVNSDGERVQANTLGEYIGQTWPLTGPLLLKTLELLVLSQQRASTQNFKGTMHPILTTLKLE